MPQLTALGNRIAFCATCPPPEQVTALLQSFSFTLVFQMDAVNYGEWQPVPNLPAQYHYRDEHGTEVIYLAGRDANMDGERLPVHASRFWLSPGRDERAYQNIASALSSTYRFSWRHEKGADDAR